MESDTKTSQLFFSMGPKPNLHSVSASSSKLIPSSFLVFRNLSKQRQSFVDSCYLFTKNLWIFLVYC